MSTSDFKIFKEKLEKLVKDEQEKQQVEDIKDLDIPKHDTYKHGNLQLIRLDGLALTTQGKLTKTEFFKNLSAAESKYADITLTPEEAAKLRLAYRTLTTGTGASVPMICTGDKCPFKTACIYWELNKAPVGKPCKLEYDMMTYNIVRLIEQFDIDVNNHTEVMLIQELAELIVYEARLAKILGGWTPDPSSPIPGLMATRRTKITPDGEYVEELDTHWAFNMLEKVKTKKLKILDALTGTPKSKIQSKQSSNNKSGGSYIDDIREIKDILKRASGEVIEVQDIRSD